VIPDCRPKYLEVLGTGHRFGSSSGNCQIRVGHWRKVDEY